MPQKRGFFRLALEKEITVVRKKRVDLNEVARENEYAVMDEMVLLTDISAGGAKVIGGHEFKESETVTVKIPVNEQESISIEGIVLKIFPIEDREGMFETRVMFDHVTLNAEHAIFAFINRMQGEQLKAKSMEAYEQGDTASITQKALTEERRKHIGGLKIAVNIYAIAGWLFAILLGIMVYAARPHASDPISKAFGVKYSMTWSQMMLDRIYIVSLVYMLVSIIVISMNYMRLRRRTDKINKSVAIQALFALVLVVLQTFVLKGLL